MNHRIFGKKLGRNYNERQALLKSLSYNLFTRGTIETTDAKAKAVISTVERLCSIAVKKDELTASREFGRLYQDRSFVKATLNAIKSAFGTQQMNFTRMVKSHRRQGDDALIVKLTFTKPLIVKPVEEVKEEKAEKAPKKAVKAVAKKTVKPAVKKPTVKKAAKKEQA